MAAWAATADRWLPGVFNVVLIRRLALVIDVLLLFVLGPFLIMHVRMAHKNETTIDGSRYPQSTSAPPPTSRRSSAGGGGRGSSRATATAPAATASTGPPSSGGGGATQRGSSCGGSSSDMASSPLGAKPSSSEVEMESASSRSDGARVTSTIHREYTRRHTYLPRRDRACTFMGCVWRASLARLLVHGGQQRVGQPAALGRGAVGQVV